MCIFVGVPVVPQLKIWPKCVFDAEDVAAAAIVVKDADPV